MKILSLESLRDSTTSHSLWYFEKYFGSPRASENRIFANQLAKNTKKSSFFTLSDGDGIDEICQKLGKTQGIFEVQTWLESCPTFSRFRRCHHHLTVWLELFSKLTRTAVNHSSGARHRKTGIHMETRSIVAKLAPTFRWCTTFNELLHLAECWIKYKGMVHKLIWKHLFQHCSLARTVHELLATSFLLRKT